MAEIILIMATGIQIMATMVKAEGGQIIAKMVTAEGFRTLTTGKQ
jgi:hypothetical protein